MDTQWIGELTAIVFILAYTNAHVFQRYSAIIHNLVHLMTEFSIEERRLFLQFVTGSSRLPIGGK
jgi:hypothetical protein